MFPYNLITECSTNRQLFVYRRLTKTSLCACASATSMRHVSPNTYQSCASCVCRRDVASHLRLMQRVSSHLITQVGLSATCLRHDKCLKTPVCNPPNVAILSALRTQTSMVTEISKASHLSLNLLYPRLLCLLFIAYNSHLQNWFRLLYKTIFSTVKCINWPWNNELQSFSSLLLVS